MQDQDIFKKVNLNNKNFMKINNFSYNELCQKNFLNGLENARNILTDLEKSLHKSSDYEERLLQCKASHAHTHDRDEWWDTDFSEELKSKSDTGYQDLLKAKKKLSPHHFDITESWSTMSIVCLQYQYEELSKRYESLLKVYNKRCDDASGREEALRRTRRAARRLLRRLAEAHTALLAVGQKYLALKRRRNVQVCLYEMKMVAMKSRLRDVVSSLERARRQLDGHFSQNMALEQDSNYALLLAEMRKCNQLFIENLRLKAQLEEFMPGCIQWNNN